ncbi:hypothetical protein [Neobacillus sp. PS3-40]|uniref:hypothetical protein n=1 Tax=Neobacillus sp. PS3-40 TaxID=3070679 RepID=UPI0027E0643A|nr:hypothetical protein [Neobacillus sp. PS3-40]WML45445.1 hypothetical protein RCG20_05960 [Neobacillus sp. PS3-40]
MYNWIEKYVIEKFIDNNWWCFPLNKKYLVVYIPTVFISIILFYILPQDKKYLIIILPGIAGVIYNIWSKRKIK